jgi:hypothetical protein
MSWERNSEEIFLNEVLPYANLNEARCLARFFDQCLPIVKSCKTPSKLLSN